MDDDDAGEASLVYEMFRDLIDDAIDARDKAALPIREKHGLDESSSLPRLLAFDDLASQVITEEAVGMITDALEVYFWTLPDAADAGGLLLAELDNRLVLNRRLMTQQQRRMLSESHKLLEQADETEEDEEKYKMTAVQTLSSLERCVGELKEKFDEWFSSRVFADALCSIFDSEDAAQAIRFEKLLCEAFPEAFTIVEGALRDIRLKLCAQELTQAAERAQQDRPQQENAGVPVRPLPARRRF